MESSLTSKPEGKVKAHTASPAPLRTAVPKSDHGAPVGLPIFVQRSVPSLAGGEAFQLKGADGGQLKHQEEKAGVQFKLIIGERNDPYEQEADRVGDSVIAGETSSPATDSAHNNVVQSKPASPAATSQSLPAAIRPAGSGTPVSAAIREKVEPVLGVDLSQVQVHTNAADQLSVKRLGAKAFTHQNHIWVGQHHSADDVSLMAHELTHVVQQRAGLATADAGVAGESAGSLLNQMGDGGSVFAIQRDEEADTGATPKVTAAYETRLINLLRTPLDAREEKFVLSRARSVLNILAAVPDRDRLRLLARLSYPAAGDELARLYVETLASATVKTGLKALREGVKPMAEQDQPESIERFLSAVTPESVRQKPTDPALDDVWLREALVKFWLDGAAPPSSTRIELHWNVFDRTGGVMNSGTAAWDPSVPKSTEMLVRTVQTGRYQMTIDLVDDGVVIKRLERAFVVGTVSGAAALRDLKSKERINAADLMSDREVTAQAHLLREQLKAFDGKTGSDANENADYLRIRQALDELEWQAAMRVTDEQRLDTGAPGSQLDKATRKPAAPADLDSIDTSKPGAVRAQLEAMIRQYGIAGTRKRLDTYVAEAYMSGTGAGAGAESPRIPRARVFEQELEGFEALYKDLPDEFEPKAKNNALRMLDLSRDQINSELKRYDIVQISDHRIGPGVYQTKTDEPNDELKGMASELKKLATMKKRTLGQDPYDPPEERLEENEIKALEQEYEIALQAAVARYPSILIFAESAQHKSTPRVWEPERISAEGTNLARPLGWELHQKLLDIETARKKIENDDEKLNVWCLPRVIDVTKSSMRIAPGTIADAVIDGHSRAPGEGGWTEKLLGLFTLALAVLLAIPSGGSSLVVAAGEIAMVGADLYMINQMAKERATYKAFANTAIDPEHALMAEVPESADLLIALIALPVGGVGAVRALREARTAARSVRSLREVLAETGGRLTHPDVIARTREVREWALKAFKNDGKRVDRFMAELATRLGTRAPRIAVAIEHGEKVVDFGADLLARRFGVSRIHVVEDLKAAVSLRPAVVDGRLVVSEVRVSRATTIGELADHLGSINAIERYNGVTGKLRLAWDRMVDLVTGSRRVNPYRLEAGTPGFRIFEEVRKHESILRSRMERLAEAFRKGDARAAGLIEDEIKFYEGELAYWNRELREIEAGGARAIDTGIEARRPGDVHKEAIDAGYPKLPEGHRYRRTDSRTPGREFEAYSIKAEQRGQDILDEFSDRARYGGADEGASGTSDVYSVRDDVRRRGQERAAIGPSARVLAGPRSDLAKFIPPPGPAFEAWFDGLSTRELDALLANPSARSVIAAAIRHPGGLHEWLMVAEARRMKVWGVSMQEIRSARTLTEETIGRFFAHGTAGSGRMHRELRDIITRSRGFNDFKQRLNEWADRSLFPVPGTQWPSQGHLGRYYLPAELQMPPEGVRMR
jgi:hypothetical protein